MASTRRSEPVSRLTGSEPPDRGRVRRAILAYVAENQWQGLSRYDIMDDLERNQNLGATRDTIAKTLGRLMSQPSRNGDLVEYIRLNRRSPRIQLKHRCYVAISVDLASMRAERKEAESEDARAELAEKKGQIPDEPKDRVKTQGEMVEELIAKTSVWARGYVPPDARPKRRTVKRKARGGNEAESHREQSPDGLPHVALLNWVIGHGALFDILVSIMYDDEDDVMRYVREVVQNIPHVRATQTMFAAARQRERDRHDKQESETQSR